jgi:thiosulfate dehydrogenase (quinone) large subunit
MPRRRGILHVPMSDSTAKTWAVLLARLVLGLIFFMAGVWKVFVLGPAGHVQRFFLPFQHTFLPVWSLWAVGFTIPFVELIAGGLVIIGWKIRYALAALGVVLVIVTFGHLLEQPLYAFHEHVIPRLALVLLVLLMPAEVDRFSLDHLLKRRGAGAVESD